VKLPAVQLWQRRRERKAELHNRRKRPSKWGDRTPVDEALSKVRAALEGG
jgi:hypothetical protein